MRVQDLLEENFWGWNEILQNVAISSLRDFNLLAELYGCLIVFPFRQQCPNGLENNYKCRKSSESHHKRSQLVKNWRHNKGERLFELCNTVELDQRKYSCLKNCILSLKHSISKPKGSSLNMQVDLNSAFVWYSSSFCARR